MPEFFEPSVDVGRKPLKVAQNMRAKPGEAMDHGLAKAVHFDGEREFLVSEYSISLGADPHGELIEDILHEGVLAPKMHVEGLLADTQFAGEFVHRERTVAVGEKIFVRESQNAGTGIGLGRLNSGR